MTDDTDRRYAVQLFRRQERDGRVLVECHVTFGPGVRLADYAGWFPAEEAPTGRELVGLALARERELLAGAEEQVLRLLEGK